MVTISINNQEVQADEGTPLSAVPKFAEELARAGGQQRKPVVLVAREGQAETKEICAGQGGHYEYRVKHGDRISVRPQSMMG
jgi:hypothetical protein